MLLDDNIDFSNIKLSTDQLEQLLRNASVQDTLSTSKMKANSTTENKSNNKKRERTLEESDEPPGVNKMDLETRP